MSRDDDDQWEHIGVTSMNAVNWAQRMQLSKHIRKTLTATQMDPESQARWLRAEAACIIREAERAKRPLEVFPADDVAEAF